MPPSLSVKVGADTTDLNAKMALAQANLRAFSAETRGVAEQVRVAGDAEKATLIPQLEASAVAAAKARAEMAALNAEMKHSSSSVFAGARHDIEALGAPIREITGLAATMGEVFLVGLGVERVLSFVEAQNKLGAALLKQSEMTNVAVETLSGWHYAAMQSNVATESLDTSLVRLGRSVETALTQPNSRAALGFHAMGISQDFLREHSNDLVSVLYAVADAFKAHEGGMRADAIAQDVFSRGGADIITFLQKGSVGIRALVDEQKKLGGQWTHEMAESAHSHEKDINRLSAAWGGFAARLNGDVGGALSRTSLGLADVFAAWNALLDAEKADRGADGIVDHLLGGGKATITTDARGATGRWGEPSAADHGAAGKGGEEKPQFPVVSEPIPPLDAFRAKLSEMQADWTGTHTDMLRESVRMWQQEAQVAGLTQKEKIEAEKGYADARRALNQAVSAENLAISKNDAQTDLSISRMKIEAHKNALDVELQADQITAEQKRAILRQLTEDEYGLNLKALQDQLETLNAQPVEYERVYNQIRELKARHELDMAALDRQASLDAKKQASEQSKSWKDAVGEITSAETGMVRSLMGGRTTFTQAALQASNQLVTGEIANDLKYLSVKALNSAFELGLDEKTAQGGLFAHLLFQSKKTAATATGEAARTTAVGVGAAAQTTTVAAGEVMQTTAVAVGTEARVATQEAGAVESLAISAATALKQVAIDAYTAAAGAYAAIAAIPFVGPFLAPIAAAASLAAVFMIGKSITSSAGGDWQVPEDRLNYVHKNETIMPASVASPMRDFFSGGAKSSGGGGTTHGDTHFNGPLVHVAGSNATPDAIAKALKEAIRSFHPALKMA